MVKVGLGQVLGPGSKLKIHLLWEMTLTFFFSNLRFVVATTVPGFIRDFGGECFISSVFIIIIIMVIASKIYSKGLGYGWIACQVQYLVQGQSSQFIKCGK